MEEMWNGFDEQTQATAICSYDSQTIHYIVKVSIGEKEQSVSFPAFQVPVNKTMLKADLNTSYEIAVKLADFLSK